MEGKLKREMVREKYLKHRKEAIESIQGWKDELNIAEKYHEKEDIEYQQHCIFMIQIWENTLNRLDSLIKSE